MEIRVGQTIYTVRREQFEGEAGNNGATYTDSSQIIIAPLISDGVYRTTLLHEVMHTCANFAGIENKDKLTEEEFITRIAPVFLMVLADNPELVAELLKHETA